MPKLPKKIAKTVENAEMVSTEFEILPDGKYTGTLVEVEVETHQNYPNNVSVWAASFTDLVNYKTGKKYPGRQWLRLNVITSEEMPANYPNGKDKWETFVRMSNGQLHAFFENMGYSADSDTDEMIAEPAMLNITSRTAQKGKRAGEKVNEVRGVVPFPEDFDPDSIGGDSDDDDDSAF